MTAGRREQPADDVVLSVTNLEKTYVSGGSTAAHRSVRAIEDVGFEVRRGEIFSLLGPSGCGKTTTLRCIAGFEHPDAGEVVLDRRVLYSAADGVSVPANRRALGMVFQNYAIWPHMSVRQNAAYPLTVMPRRTRPSKAQIDERVDRVLGVVGLEQTANRKATALSGGQQQRLALARAIISEPALLLLDEPVSNLDARVRDDVLAELRRLQSELGMTMLYVTHDQREALSLSNTVAVMDNGSVAQVGSATDIYDRPATRFVANFIGRSNLLEGSVVEVGPGGSCTVLTRIGTVGGIAATAPRVGDAVAVSIRPEAVRFLDTSLAGTSTWQGTVVSRLYFGEVVEHIVDIQGLQFQVRCRPFEARSVGDAVIVGMQSGSAAILR